MKSFSFELFKIDLRIINTVDNCKRLLKDNDITEDKVSAEKLFALKTTVDIIFFDKVTFSIFAFIRKREKQIEFVKELNDELFEIESIKYVKIEPTIQSETLKLDNILEKISTKGMNSLTPREREFLDLQSKK
jgi:hypothetical protein